MERHATDMRPHRPPTRHEDQFVVFGFGQAEQAGDKTRKGFDQFAPYVFVRDDFVRCLSVEELENHKRQVVFVRYGVYGRRDMEVK